MLQLALSATLYHLAMCNPMIHQLEVSVSCTPSNHSLIVSYLPVRSAQKRLYVPYNMAERPCVLSVIFDYL